jgi:protein-tyrosine phosphatase
VTTELSKLNFRDLGGLRARSGQVVKRGLLYRSEGPANYSSAHRDELAALGVRTVCDLRSEAECSAEPNDWCGPACRVLHLSMNTDLRARDDTVWESFRSDPSAENTRRVMMQAHTLMPAALSPHWPLITGAIVAGETPLIVHCTAGKDRTGVAIALLLELLQIPPEEIIADYAKSDVFAQNMRMAGTVESGFRKTFGFVPPEAAIDLLIGTEREYLRAALQEVDRRWGSIERYFSSSGVDAAEQAAVRGALLQG